MSVYMCLCVNMKCVCLYMWWWLGDWDHCHMSWGSLRWIETKWWNQTLQFLFCPPHTDTWTHISLLVCLSTIVPFSFNLSSSPIRLGLCHWPVAIESPPKVQFSCTMAPALATSPLLMRRVTHDITQRALIPHRAIQSPWCDAETHMSSRPVSEWAEKSKRHQDFSPLTARRLMGLENNDGKCFSKLTLILLHGSLECLVLIGQCVCVCVCVCARTHSISINEK